jgi:hypothetical protein
MEESIGQLERLAAARGKRQSFVGTLSDDEIALLAHESYLTRVALFRDVRLPVPVSICRPLD